MTQVEPLQSPSRTIRKSDKLADVCYDIRGPVLTAANQLEAEGHQILKLNIGNPAPWGFNAPEEILRDVVRNIPNSQAQTCRRECAGCRSTMARRVPSARRRGDSQRSTSPPTRSSRTTRRCCSVTLTSTNPGRVPLRSRAPPPAPSAPRFPSTRRSPTHRRSNFAGAHPAEMSPEGLFHGW